MKIFVDVGCIFLYKFLENINLHLTAIVCSSSNNRNLVVYISFTTQHNLSNSADRIKLVYSYKIWYNFKICGFLNCFWIRLFNIKFYVNENTIMPMHVFFSYLVTIITKIAWLEEFYFVCNEYYSIFKSENTSDTSQIITSCNIYSIILHISYHQNK